MGKKVTIDQDELIKALPDFISKFIVQPDVVTPPVVVKPPVVEPPVVVQPPEQTEKYTEVGSGSGVLKLGDISGKRLIVKPGKYTGITISKAVDSKLNCNGISMTSGTIQIGDFEGFELIGFTIADQKGRAMTITGKGSNFKMTGCYFKNVADYVVFYDNKTAWDGTDKTVSANWTFDKCVFDNTGRVFECRGGMDGKVIRNLMKNFTFSNSTVKNSPYMGDGIFMQAVDGYNVFGNTIDNVNTLNNQHNGIFHMIGNGHVFANKLTNHQGNLIRAWGMSYGSIVRNIEIYGNEVFNSRKYSAFELQVTPEMESFIEANPKLVTVTNAKVHKNTAGNLAIEKDWDGQMLDLYNTGGTLVYEDNIGFAMRGTKKITNMINNMSDVPVTEKNNKYFTTAKEASAAGYPIK